MILAPTAAMFHAPEAASGMGYDGRALGNL